MGKAKGENSKRLGKLIGTIGSKLKNPNGFSSSTSVLSSKTAQHYESVEKAQSLPVGEKRAKTSDIDLRDGNYNFTEKISSMPVCQDTLNGCTSDSMEQKHHGFGSKNYLTSQVSWEVKLLTLARVCGPVAFMELKVPHLITWEQNHKSLTLKRRRNHDFGFEIYTMIKNRLLYVLVKSVDVKGPTADCLNVCDRITSFNEVLLTSKEAITDLLRAKSRESELKITVCRPDLTNMLSEGLKYDSHNGSASSMNSEEVNSRSATRYKPPPQETSCTLNMSTQAFNTMPKRKCDTSPNKCDKTNYGQVSTSVQGSKTIPKQIWDTSPHKGDKTSYGQINTSVLQGTETIPKQIWETSPYKTSFGQINTSVQGSETIPIWDTSPYKTTYGQINTSVQGSETIPKQIWDTSPYKTSYGQINTSVQGSETISKQIGDISPYKGDKISYGQINTSVQGSETIPKQIWDTSPYKGDKTSYGHINTSVQGTETIPKQIWDTSLTEYNKTNTRLLNTSVTQEYESQWDKLIQEFMSTDRLQWSSSEEFSYTNERLIDSMPHESNCKYERQWNTSMQGINIGEDTLPKECLHSNQKFGDKKIVVYTKCDCGHAGISQITGNCSALPRFNLEQASTGPASDKAVSEETYLHQLPYKLIEDLSWNLLEEAVKNWKDLADCCMNMSYTNVQIFEQKNRRNPALALLVHLGQSKKMTVKNLLTVLSSQDMERKDLVEIIENRMKKF